MSENTIKGGLKELEGKVQSAWGQATGNVSTQLKGEVKQTTGNAQKNIGKIQDDISSEN